MCVATCPAGQSACGAACVDVTVDAQRCGGCGITCVGAKICVSGACACPNKRHHRLRRPMCRPGDELDGLRRLRSRLEPGGLCSGGACVPSCPSPTTQCGSSCVTLVSDEANCGTCGAACPSGAECSNGVCRCPTGSLVCSGRCVDPQSDAANCGACGVVCDVGRTCSSGRCTCHSGLTDCQGACADTSTDVRNCGACGTLCAPEQVCTGQWSLRMSARADTLRRPLRRSARRSSELRHVWARLSCRTKLAAQERSMSDGNGQLCRLLCRPIDQRGQLRAMPDFSRAAARMASASVPLAAPTARDSVRIRNTATPTVADAASPARRNIAPTESVTDRDRRET